MKATALAAVVAAISPIYTMSSGHAAVEILTTSPMQFVAHNEARYLIVADAAKISF